MYRSAKHVMERLKEEEQSELRPLVEGMIAACVERIKREAGEQETFKQIEDEEQTVIGRYFPLASVSRAIRISRCARIIDIILYTYFGLDSVSE